MPQNFYELVWIFIIYSFFGWCTEVAYHAVSKGVFINRGFLNGPYCPIYGCGVALVVVVLTPIKDNIMILFLGSVALTTLIELVTGFVLEKVFHNKWWDYSNIPFNFHGYICAKFSIYWGLACMMVMTVIHPIIYKFITIIPHILGVILVSIIMVGFAVDLIVTVTTILKFNKRMKLLDDMAAQIHKLSDDIGQKVFENTETILDKSAEFQESHAELIEKISNTKEEIKEIPGEAKQKIMESAAVAKQRREEKQAELEKMQEQYRELFDKKLLGMKRLVKAFPNMRSNRTNDILAKYKERFHTGTRKDRDDQRD